MGTTMSSEPSSYKYYDKSIYSSKCSSKKSTDPYSTQFSKEYWSINKEDRARHSTSSSDRFNNQKTTYGDRSGNKFVSAFCDQPNTLSSSYPRMGRSSSSSIASSTSKSNQYYTFN